MFADDKSEEKPVVDEAPVKKVKDVKAEVVKPQKEKKGLSFNKPQNVGVFIIICLLVVQVLMSGYQTFLNVQDQVQQARLIASVQKYTSTTDGVITQLLSDYKSEVYNNANVNSTAKQQVMGNEYNFMALMLVAKQNSRILELLSQLK